MLDILRTYVSSASTVEQAAVLEAAHTTFEKIGLENYEQGFEELLMIHDDVGQSETMDDIVSLTNDLLMRILRDHDVHVNVDTKTKNLTELVDGILAIQDYEDAQSVLNIINSSDDNTEILAEVLALVIPESAENLMQDIQSVGNFTIRRLRNLALRGAPYEHQTMEQLTAWSLHMGKLTMFLKVIQTEALESVEMIKQGMSFGFDFRIYANIVGRGLESMPVDQAARELVVMAIISNNGINNIQGTIKANLENYVSDIDRATRIDIAVGQYVVKLDQYYAMEKKPTP